jgi:hypothetical protein
MRSIALSAAVGCMLSMGAIAGCYDDQPVQPVRTGGSTVVVTDPKPGIASPQPAAQPAQSSPPIINNVIQPTPAPASAPAAPAATGTTVNVQPHTVNVP